MTTVNPKTRSEAMKALTKNLESSYGMQEPQEQFEEKKNDHETDDFVQIQKLHASILT